MDVVLMKFNELRINNGVVDYVFERVIILFWERFLLLNCVVSCCILDFEEGSVVFVVFLLEMCLFYCLVVIVKGRFWKFNLVWLY